MNSFWIPQLSGQIYTMTGMVTPLHVMADGPGEYAGRAAEINGQGFASMTFVAKSSSREDFDSWVNGVKQSQQRLSDKAYEALLKPSQNEPVTLFSSVEEHLFHRIVMKYMHPEGH
jgi:cytochrome o ubiquinol oxidase subunit 2